jgi:hypothetical protein
MLEVRLTVLLARREDGTKRKSQKRIVKEMLLWKRTVTMNSWQGFDFVEHVGVQGRKIPAFHGVAGVNQHPSMLEVLSRFVG